MSPRAEDPHVSPAPASLAGRGWTFTAWTYAIGWIAAAGLWLLSPTLHPGFPTNGVLSLILLLTPLLAAIVLAARWRLRVREDLGLRSPALTLMLAAPMVALGLAAATIALAVISGIGEFEPSGMGEVQRLAQEHRTEALELQLDIEAAGPPLRGRIVAGLIGGMLLGILLAPIIELPWRGLLLGEFAGKGFAHGALLSAGLAALWWLPLQLWVDLSGRPGTSPAAVTLLTYALLCVPLAWARLKTGSIFPGGVLLVTVAALSHLPALALAGGTRLQIDLCGLAAVALLAGASLIWPPRSAPGADEAEDGQGGQAEQASSEL